MIRSVRSAIILCSADSTHFRLKPPPRHHITAATCIATAFQFHFLRLNNTIYSSSSLRRLFSPTPGFPRAPETVGSSMDIERNPSPEHDPSVRSVEYSDTAAAISNDVTEQSSSSSDVRENSGFEYSVEENVSVADASVSEDVSGSFEVSGSFDSEEYGSVDEDSEKRVLPEELLKDVVVLSCESSAGSGSCDVYLVGTAHVSQESCRNVQAVISCLKPQVVFLELCARRVAILTPQNLQLFGLIGDAKRDVRGAQENLFFLASVSVPTMKEMIEMWKKKNSNAFGILYSWFLAKVAHKLEVFPGSEFRVAFEEARKYGGKVILGDRPVHITIRRTWCKMPLWHKVKFLYSILFQGVFLPSTEELDKMVKDMDDVDMLTLVVQEMSKEFPSLMETLVYERDLYMSSTLLRVAQEHASVVAVVGKGHLLGIRRHWRQPIVVNELLEIPTQKSGITTRKILMSLGVVVAGAAIISSFFLTGKR